MPFSVWGGENFNIRYEGQASDDMTVASGEYREDAGNFAATGERMLTGRRFGAGDDAAPNSPVVVVANGALVKRDSRGAIPSASASTSATPRSDHRRRRERHPDVGPFSPAFPEVYSPFQWPSPARP